MKIIFTISLLFFTNISIFAESDKFFAIVSFVRGDASFIRGGNSKKIKPRMGLLENDIIATKKGTVDIQVGPNTIIRINPNSRLKLNTYELKKSKQFITIDLESGQLFGKVKNIPKGSKVTITTPTFTGGVRGTEFAFSEGNSGDDSDQLEDGVFVTEGSVEVKRNDSPKTVTVKAGQQILSKSKEILVGILDDHNKKKMRILQTIQVMKEENYQLLQKQLEKNKEILKK